MATEHTTLVVSAFSGLAGALIAQALTGLFAYFGDKRKAETDLRNQYRNKQVEIAENYYYVTGETMSILKKSVQLWKRRNIQRSEASFKSLSESLKEADVRLKQMNIDNWRHNLIGLYFNVALSYDELIAANNKSRDLFLTVLDLEVKSGMLIMTKTESGSLGNIVLAYSTFAVNTILFTISLPVI